MFITIPKTRKWAGKQYRLVRAFVDKGTADRLRDKYKKDGYSVKVVVKGGDIHFFNKYHVYVRKRR